MSEREYLHQLLRLRKALYGLDISRLGLNPSAVRNAMSRVDVTIRRILAAGRLAQPDSRLRAAV